MSKNGTDESLFKTMAAAEHGDPGHRVDVHLLLYPDVVADHRLYGLQHRQADAGVSICRSEAL